MKYFIKDFQSLEGNSINCTIKLNITKFRSIIISLLINRFHSNLDYYHFLN